MSTEQKTNSSFRWRKKPVVIEAFPFNPPGLPMVTPEWFDSAVLVGRVHGFGEDGSCRIFTLEGVMVAMPGDWIIRGVKGEIYPCKPDIFEVTYEPA